MNTMRQQSLMMTDRAGHRVPFFGAMGIVFALAAMIEFAPNSVAILTGQKTNTTCAGSVACTPCFSSAFQSLWRLRQRRP